MALEYICDTDGTQTRDMSLNSGCRKFDCNSDVTVLYSCEHNQTYRTHCSQTKGDATA